MRYSESACYDAFKASLYAYADIPMPLPLYPDEDAKRLRLPYFGEDTPQVPTGLSDTATLAINRVYEKEFTQAARIAEADGCILIAVLTTPFFLKSERDNAMSALEAELKELVGSEELIVAFDLDIYRRIDENMSDDDIVELYNIAKLRRQKRGQSVTPG